MFERTSEFLISTFYMPSLSSIFCYLYILLCSCQVFQISRFSTFQIFVPPGRSSLYQICTKISTPPSLSRNSMGLSTFLSIKKQAENTKFNTKLTFQAVLINSKMGPTFFSYFSSNICNFHTLQNRHLLNTQQCSVSDDVDTYTSVDFTIAVA